MTAHQLRMIAIVRRSVAGLLAGALLASVPVDGQSLGDVARREQARRETTAKGKVYTNGSLADVSDLPAPAARAAAAPGDAAQAAGSAAPAGGDAAKPQADGAAAAPKGDRTKEDAKKEESHWRDRMAKARETLSRSEAFAEALQSRINALSTDFANRDDPAQRGVIAADREKALAELNRVKKEVKDNQKAIEDLRDEARREGVPAGWVR
jgi:hypothetical protein